MDSFQGGPGRYLLKAIRAFSRSGSCRWFLSLHPAFFISVASSIAFPSEVFRPFVSPPFSASAIRFPVVQYPFLYCFRASSLAWPS